MQYNYALPAGTILQSDRRSYKVEEVLGAGGFGITYKVSSTIMVDNVPATTFFAIKEHFMKGCDRAADGCTVTSTLQMREEVEQCKKDFIVEAKRLNRLSGLSENIVRVNEVFENYGTAYYVMQYLSGGEVADYVNNHGAMTEEQTLRIIIPVAQAVSLIHKEKLLHLDIKPNNILLMTSNRNGQIYPVLIDFGIAKHFTPSGKPTSNHSAKGASDGYAPMEQYAEIDEFAPTLDVYALGATMLFMLTGRVPKKAFSVSPGYVDGMLPDKISENTRKAIIKAMMPMAIDRTPTVLDFIQSLTLLGHDKRDDNQFVSVVTVPLRKQKKELEQAEKERISREKAEQERLEKERQEAERQRIKAEKERIAREKAEQERLEKERQEAERQRIKAEKERIAREKAEQERLEKERLAKVRAEKERIEKERKEAERKRLRAEKERLAKEKVEKERLEKERQEAERQRIKAEKERIAREKAETVRLEKIRTEQKTAEKQNEQEHIGETPSSNKTLLYVVGGLTAGLTLFFGVKVMMNSDENDMDTVDIIEHANIAQDSVPSRTVDSLLVDSLLIVEETKDSSDNQSLEITKPDKSSTTAEVIVKDTKQETQLKLQQEEQAKSKQEAKIKTQLEVEAQKNAQREAQAKAQQEAQRKAKQEAQQRAEQESIEKAQREAEAARKAEEARKAAEAAAKVKAEQERLKKIEEIKKLNNNSNVTDY